jgi:hypothetical protein
MACRDAGASHPLHGRGAGLDGLDDVVIAGAAAKIAFELFAHGAFVEVMALAAHHVDGRHDHAGCAKATLQAMVLAKRLLHRMEPAVGGETFDGRDLGAVEGDRERRAGLDGVAVRMDRAAAALAGVAADMGAGQAQVLAQELDEQRAPLDFAADRFAVHGHGNDGHDFSSQEILAALHRVGKSEACPRPV